MKRILALLLLACLLCGCAGAGETDTTVPTTAAAEPTAEPTTEPTTVPTEPPVVHRNPLNGEILEEPFTGRIWAHTITNTPDALPHVGVNQADLFFECHVSRGVVRCLAMYTDLSDVEAIGATRSTRLLFNQFVHAYDAIFTHGGGFLMVLQDANGRQLDHFNVDSLYRQGDPLMKATAYRDKVYKRQAPNNLFGYGPGIVEYVESLGVRTTQPADKEYYLNFVEDGTPANGEVAEEIIIEFGDDLKTTTMIYDETLGKYVYNQYGQVMRDQITDEVEAFNNVIVMQADMYENYVYQEANFHVGGWGYYACGGKLVPIKWTCPDSPAPFRFFTEDGEPLQINTGNTYIAVLSFLNEVKWQEATPPETEPVETTAETLAETIAETTAETIPETTAG